MKVTKILMSKAIPGMVLAKDILDYSGKILVADGTTLTDKIISKLQFYAIQSLLVQMNDQGEIVNAYEDSHEDSPSTSDWHLEKIRNTKEFQEFQEEFYAYANHFQSYIDQVITTDVPLDLSYLLNSTNKVMGKSRNTIHLFDMINCMRAYDDSTYSHCINVSLICNVFGQWIHLSQADVDTLTLCGLFHDIGKLEIPQSIIMKPDRLTDDEYRMMKKHTLMGYDLLKDRDIDIRIKKAALMHHERLDGSGYPQHLKGDQIDNFSKIVAIADVYDALTSKRVYREPLCPFEVLHIFEREGFVKYDPAYLVVFFQKMFATYVSNTVRLNDGSEGKIIMLNKQALADPIVQIGSEFIDLSKHKDLYIQAIL
ncbi:HD-GYP domain-containing protein [Anaerosporobacter faecicola]|uniref:HD-GYP domain-containing protein n=1 Tax=Anaerosporobacter faecicola TaxID=2718714 RepID=UPI001438B9A0|nr:HD-GYP domain-containing protein [Anaerosporobacter faecicola]